jgi:hypothetical protein
MLQLRPGQVERHTHDYKRNGALNLFAALEVATGRVTNQTAERHRAVEVLDFLNLLARPTRGAKSMSSSTPSLPIRHPRSSAGSDAISASGFTSPPHRRHG